ncbi:MAG TPA: fimbrial assembly protein [Acidobacteriaceae bacterium]|jgi:type IV pilus assembly protein PilN|nr:fimbrial assembly protein [Acidobacteriaceae bacterium]
MKITLNLATRPYADQGPALKRLRIGMLVLVVMLAALGFGLMHFHQAALRMAAEEDAVDRQIAIKEREQQGYRAQMQQPANARVLQQAQFLNSLFDEKAFSWTVAMEDLERVLPPGVQVTAIEPVRAKDGRLTLHLRVTGQRERAIEMVRYMERSKRFTAPRISGENTENAVGGLQVVREPGRVTFEVLAEYNPPTLDERKAEIAAQKHTSTRASTRETPGANMQLNAQPRHALPATARQPMPRMTPGGAPGGGPMRARPTGSGGLTRPPGSGAPPKSGTPQPPGGTQ